MLRRPRRNRKSPALRRLMQETQLRPSDLILPCFVLEGTGRREAIVSLPGVERLSVDLLIEALREYYAKGICAAVLFPVVPPERKDEKGSEALRAGNLMSQALQALKEALPELCIITDVALDPYTSHGHDGLLDSKGHVANDPTLELLGEMALLHAQMGADVVAPSDMMDGRVRHIRQYLDAHGHSQVSILSYTAKYASSLYGPFRDALGSQPRFGDKKTYQMNPANAREALLESLLDEEEGADMLLVKPALAYLDVLAKMRQETSLPLGAYHVSGEYAMIMAAAEKGWIQGPEVMYESLLSIKRAGADYIITYGISQVLEKILREPFGNLSESCALR